jgi:signal transduction histidine kinase
MAMVITVTAVTAYVFWRVDRVEENVETTNQFYVPVLKHMNLLSGKWSAYQRSFEQSVNFRRWGSAEAQSRGGARLPLKKMIDSNLSGLAAILLKPPTSRPLPERAELSAWVERVSALAERESVTLAELAGFVKAKRYGDAAELYSRTRQEHSEISQELSRLTREMESHLSLMQLSTETELRDSQSVMLVLLASSLIFSLFVLLRLRRWMAPILQWTRVAQEIAMKGIHRGMEFPKVTSKMPPAISLLTREFTRMGMTILERERTINQQKERLGSLNSHLKEQNEMLRKLGGLNERVLNSMSAGLLVIGRDGSVEQFNDRYCALFKADRASLLGSEAKLALNIWPDEVVDVWLNSTEARARYKLSGRVFDVSVTELHAQAGLLMLFEDVTELTQAEERLEHAKKLVLAGNMSSQVAHEVRNPLNSMSLQLEMLEEDLLDADSNGALSKSARIRVQAVSEQIERLERITRRYLDVVQPEVHGHNPVDLHQLVEKSLAFLNAEIQVARVRVELDLDSESAMVSGDADALSQVLFNLIRNALEAMKELPEDKRVLKLVTATETVTGTENRKQITVQVQDSGPGLSREVHPRVFEPFVTDKPNGHGLGLSISRQICISHGGELRCVSAVGEGAAFEFSLPLHSRDRAKEAPPCTAS